MKKKTNVIEKWEKFKVENDFIELAGCGNKKMQSILKILHNKNIFEIKNVGKNINEGFHYCLNL